MSKNIRIVLIVIALCAAIGAAVGYKLYMQPTQNDFADTAADVSISAQELFNDFETDEAKAKAKYLNKIVEVTGVAQEVSTSNDGSVNIVMREPDEMMGGVLGNFMGENAKDAAAMKVGDKVSFKGECTGFLDEVNVMRCVVVKH